MSPRLPPLNAVRVFEACARHLSFTRAADELAVSHSAVSKQIAALEDHVGERLFDRSRGGVVLTAEGARLRDAVSPAIEQLRYAFDEHRRERPESRVLRVTTVASLAAHFLMPNYAALASAAPYLDIKISTTDRPVDLSREATDVAIRYGRGDWPGLNTSPLTPGRLTAVVRPDRKHDAQTMPRMQTFATDEWRFVDPSQRPTGPTIACQHFVVAIESAREGLGVALLPNILVRHSLNNGQLAEFPIADVDWPDTFHFATHFSARRSKDTEKFSEALSGLV
ncbi:MAG: LysR substrate-binding domain-containing protein [Pseudomonadota bacterium]